MKNENQNTFGLIDLISQAMSETEIKELVSKGKLEYKNANPKTIRRWNSVAKRRILELNTPESLPVEKKTEKKKGVKK